MSKNLVSFSMHPRWVYNGTTIDFLEPLRAVGLGALEFELDANGPDWPRFIPSMENCQQLGFTLCFHAPYKTPYTIAGFAGQERAAIEVDYAPMLDIAARFGPTTVVVHGAHSPTRSYEELCADTVAFLRWALARYPSLTFALENLCPDPNLTKTGVTRAGLLHLVEEIDDPRLGICWDMGHDVLAGRYDLPDDAWLQHVCHVHVHDVDSQGIDHYPFVYGRVPYQSWLPALAETGFAAIVTLEIKSEQLIPLGMAQIMEMLVSSISEIRRLLTV
jgi:sugar phosphate isomerase/epimerase